MVLNGFKLTVLLCLLLVISTTSVRAQNALDDIEEEDRIDSSIGNERAPDLVTESIRSIGGTKKIFILTNENQSFTKGDFISLLLANKLVCRALVAKTTPDKISGIKIVKIYNSNLWKQLNPGKEVLVLKGDDSYYSNKEKSPAKDQVDNQKKNDSKLQSDEDLFNSTSLSGNDDDLSLEESNKRLIKPDNILSFNVGLIEGKDFDGTKKNYTQASGAWTYQLSDNIWAEAAIGRNTVRDLPDTGIDTSLTNIEVRAKYTFSAPFYSYIQPYLGYQSLLVSSPSAGLDPDGTSGKTPSALAAEVTLVNSMKKSRPIFGVTILKRIVPGWFARADLGTDIINGGLAIEF